MNLVCVSEGVYHVAADGETSTTTDSIVVDNADRAQANLTILNSLANFSLPITGGMGTAIFTICGILLMGGAILLVAMLARKRR